MDDIQTQVLSLAPFVRALRRDLHQYPEAAWMEYRTAALAARHLLNLGYTVTMGEDAVQAEARLNPPDAVRSVGARERAVSQGADPALVARMGDGFTGLWGDLRCPDDAAVGPLVALRFDMDCNAVVECADADHLPAREGFASRHHGCMHACGHDGHTAMGMGLAAMIKALRPRLQGTVRLIFQPAEEAGQGGLAMTAAGAVKGVDRLLGVHLGIQASRTGEVICGTSHFLATTNFEVTFEGAPAHAGMNPQEGRNALLAACTAVQGMQAIARHGGGASRINVGQLLVEGASNVIPAKAWLSGETRGDTSAIDAYMMEEVERITEGAAGMWGCQGGIRRVGACPSGASSPELSALVEKVARRMPEFKHVIPMACFHASEDFTWLLNRVHEQGGLGTFLQIGANAPGGHHTGRFDVDEQALLLGMELLARVTAHCLSE